MPRYAVSHIDWSDNELTTDIVEAPSLLEAIKKSPKAYAQVKHVFDAAVSFFDPDSTEAERLDVLKTEAFNCDGMINVVEIPDK